MAEVTQFVIYSNTAPILRFTLPAPVNISGWTTKFYVKNHPGGTLVLSKDGGTSSVPAAVTKGIFDVSLSASDTLGLGIKTYSWSFERLDAGFEDVLALGTLSVEAH
jgi:hypothetical protein